MTTITRKLDRTNASRTDDRLNRQGPLSPEFSARGGDHQTQRGLWK